MRHYSFTRYLLANLLMVAPFAIPTAQAQQAPEVLWHLTLGGSSDEFCLGLEISSQGHVLVVGSNNSTDGDIPTAYGLSDLVCANINGDGELVWIQTYGGSLSDGASHIRQGNDGSLTVIGATASNDGDIQDPGYGGADIWILSLDQSGDLQNQKRIGSSSWDYGCQTIATNDGGMVVLGATGIADGAITVNHGFDDFWIAKLDHDNNIVWQNAFGGSNLDTPYSMLNTQDGGYIIAGSHGQVMGMSRVTIRANSVTAGW